MVNNKNSESLKPSHKATNLYSNRIVNRNLPKIIANRYDANKQTIITSSNKVIIATLILTHI